MSRLEPLILGVLLAAGCASRDGPPRAAVPLSEAPGPTEVPPSVAATPAVTEQPPIAAVDTFQSEVRPLLASRCTPCHVPGGKMYERLPFDDPETVRNNREGVLRRLKGDDKAVLERWLDGS